MPDSVVFCVAMLLALTAASILALVLGALLAAWLAMARFAARRALLVVLGALAAVPPGLAVALLAGHWAADDRLAAAAMLAAWAMLAAPLALLLTHGSLAAGWARHGRGLQSAGASRWQALGPLLASQRRALAVAWLAVLARGLGELAVALALGLLPVAVTPLLPLGLAVVLGGIAVWLKARVLF
jgi:tungstate transport system permease protein